MSYLFNGSTDYVYLGNALGFTDYPLTIAAWMWGDNSISTATAVSFGDTDTTNSYQRMEIQASTNDLEAYSKNGLSTHAESTGMYPDETWFHGVATFGSATSRKISLNGATYDSEATSIAWDTNLDTFSVGALRNGSGFLQPWMGRIAEVAIWNIALSQEDATALAGGANPLTIQPDNLVAYWPMVDDLVDDVNGWTLSAVGTPAADGSHPTVDAPPDIGGEVTYIDLTVDIEADVTVDVTVEVYTIDYLDLTVEINAEIAVSAGVQIIYVGISFNLVPDRPSTYDPDLVWDEDSGTWLSTVEESLVDWLVAIGEQGEVYWGQV